MQRENELRPEWKRVGCLDERPPLADVERVIREKRSDALVLDPHFERGARVLAAIVVSHAFRDFSAAASQVKERTSSIVLGARIV